MATFLARLILAASLAIVVSPTSAAPQGNRTYAVVDSVQMPAWVERNGARQPLEPGEILQDSDRVVTGANAKALIRLAEGSAVKLGENAQLDLNELGWRNNRVFTAVLDVAKGAFRFTTGIFSKIRKQRDVNVRIATITAGIRGTDLWGSSDAERDLVCLLEGRISVSHPQDEVRVLNEPLSFYIVSKGKAPDPVGKVDQKQVEKWAAQTEVRPGQGFARRGGRWQVELAVFALEKDALELYDRARTAGYAAHIYARKVSVGLHRYSVRISQLPSRAEAAILAERLTKPLDLSAPVAIRRS